MDAAMVASLEAVVSAPRLWRYRQASANDLETVVLYAWNIQLAESLVPSLAILEVALRNAVHNVFTVHAGSEFWFEKVLRPEKHADIVKLVERLTKRLGHPPTAGKVISELTFGFWPLLFSRHNHSRW